MTIRRLLQIYSLLLTVILVEIGCDRTPQPSIQQKEPAEVAELIELSMEALIDRMVTMEKETREKKSKSGGSHAGLIDGKLWQTTPEEMRIAYMRGIADFASSLYGVMVADMVERENLITTKALDFLTRPEPIDTRSVLANRMSEVVSSGSISDLVDAVTRFYQNKPLMKEKPVLWVLTVPLYKEVQESKPKDKRSYSDVVTIKMKKKTQ